MFLDYHFRKSLQPVRFQETRNFIMKLKATFEIQQRVEALAVPKCVGNEICQRLEEFLRCVSTM